ncbi:hypothetical protein EI94DRAFT_1713164 [Lactarius quietus]|nr:hypothetical protein EI94DRAFT_1713164 [Lactarius quietus]
MVVSLPTLAVTVNISLTAPSSAQALSSSLVSFSLEQDRWADWVGDGAGNSFFFNTPPRVRIGGNSEDRTNFDSSVQFSDINVPYPEASADVVGDNFYRLASSLPSGTAVTWGVNFGQLNLTAASLEATAIACAFASQSFKDSDVILEAIEIGNEADLYISHGDRNSSFNVQQYILGMETPLQGAAFAESSHTTTGFSPESIFQNGILSSPAGCQINLISQHHYSSTFCSGTPGVLQDLMSKSFIRSNLTQFSPDIAAVQQKGLTYVLGETNSISCHGAPNVSNTAGAALWALDYVLFAGQLGMTRVYFHNGIGFRYNFVRSYGSSGSTCVTELDVSETQVSGYAFFEGSVLARAVFINLNAFTSGMRGSVHVDLEFSGYGQQSYTVTVKRLSVPTANATEGITWAGQTYETADGRVAGTLYTETINVSQGFDISDTEVVMLCF